MDNERLIALCRVRAASYGGLRKSSLTAIALDHAATRITQIEGELAKARDEALEEAAHTAVSFLVGDPRNGIPLRSPSPHEIARAIRALTRKEKP